MNVARLHAAFAVALTVASCLPAQQQKAPPGYPEQDILSPFRNPQEIAAPPDALFAQLRIMRRIADDPAAVRSFDATGREVIDDETWRNARKQAEAIGIDAAVLAALMRNSRNADERAIAFYAGFYSNNEEHVFNLISHIPGEPERKTRERSYPRAIAFLRANIDRKFGDLTPEEQKMIVRDMPQPGSPAAHAAGIQRLPEAGDPLFQVNLKPFFQLLDLDDPLDQAQGLWFLKEAFAKRPDLAQKWFEPVLPRARQLLIAEDARVREQAIGVFAAIAPKGLATPAVDATAAALDTFADQAIREMFPPIRRISDGLYALQPSKEREAIVAAGCGVLDTDRIGEATSGKTQDGTRYRGFRVDRVPDELAILGIPKGAIITAINGVPVSDSKSVLATLRAQFVVKERGKDGTLVPRELSRARIFVDLIVGQETRAIEYRVL